MPIFVRRSVGKELPLPQEATKITPQDWFYFRDGGVMKFTEVQPIGLPFINMYAEEEEQPHVWCLVDNGVDYDAARKLRDNYLGTPVYTVPEIDDLNKQAQGDRDEIKATIKALNETFLQFQDAVNAVPEKLKSLFQSQIEGMVRDEIQKQVKVIKTELLAELKKEQTG